MSSGFLGRGIGPTPIARRRAASVGWWDGNATIPLANVLEYVENPAARQLYAGPSATGAWSVSFRTNLLSAPTVGQTAFAFDAQTGRLGIGYGGAVLVEGIFITLTWYADDLIITGDHSYMIVSDGTNIQCYRDAVAHSTAITNGVDIGGAVRWRSRHADIGSWYEWPVAIRAGHVANVALNATQRAALHAAMMALA